MRFTILDSAVLLRACLGQSGSEVIPPIKKPDPNPTPVDPGPQPVPPGIPPQPHCPCDGLREYQHIRATVVGVESFETITNLRRYALRVDEILSDAQRGEASLRPTTNASPHGTSIRSPCITASSRCSAQASAVCVMHCELQRSSGLFAGSPSSLVSSFGQSPAHAM